MTSGTALARRLYLHVREGGSVTEMDMSRLVIEMERIQHERNFAQSERDRLAVEHAKAQRAILPWIEQVGWLNAAYDIHTAALHRISLGSVNSGTTKEFLGEEARAAIRDGSKK